MEEMTAAEFREKHAESPSTERKSNSRPSTKQKRHSGDTDAMRRIREADKVSVIRDCREDEPVRYAVGLEEALTLIDEVADEAGLSVRVEVSIGRAKNQTHGG